jgi:inhibitor of KinA
LGDTAVLVRFGDRIDPGTLNRVLAFRASLEAEPLPGMVEHVPAFASVAVYYDPLRVSEAEIVERIRERRRHLPARPAAEPRVVEIPVCYGGSFGPDLPFVAEYHGLTPDEVVAIHSGAEYTVYMIGFAPGFPYLGGLPERIATPRRDTPRLSIPAGSVGIAGAQTGVYPLETPGGWQIIGRTPLRLFRPEAAEPSLLRPGDVVRFRPLPPEAFDQWKEAPPVG